MTDFDYQWKHLTKSPYLDCNVLRVQELLSLTDLTPHWFNNKKCLDAGCGAGRYTYAMMQLGANVTSIDDSIPAVDITKKLNPQTFLINITKDPLPLNNDLTFAFGVIHHTQNPRHTFHRLARTVKRGGYLFVMVYRKPGQEYYDRLRPIFHKLPSILKLPFIYLVTFITTKRLTNIHGWWDALNPTYNYSFTDDEIATWFREEGFTNFYKSSLPNVNMIGQKL